LKKGATARGEGLSKGGNIWERTRKMFEVYKRGGGKGEVYLGGES